MRQSVFAVLQKTVISDVFCSVVFSQFRDIPKYCRDKSLANPSITASVDSQVKAKDVDPTIRASIQRNYGNLPLSFEVNNGQVDDAVKYLVRGNGYTLFLTSGEAVLSLRRGSLKEKQGITGKSPKTDKSEATADDVIRLKLVGANPKPKITGLDELPGKSNYFIGNDSGKWRTKIRNFGDCATGIFIPALICFTTASRASWSMISWFSRR